MSPLELFGMDDALPFKIEVFAVLNLFKNFREQALKSLIL